MQHIKKPTPVSSAIQRGKDERSTARTATPASRSITAVQAVQRQKQLAQALTSFTTHHPEMQRQAAQPALHAAGLERQEIQRLADERTQTRTQADAIQRQYTPEQLSSAVQRQQAQTLPATLLRQPHGSADWVTVMRHQATQTDGRQMNSREFSQFTALQRHVAQTLAQGFRQDRQPAMQRYAEYGTHLATLQRHPVSGQVASAVMNLIPQGERPMLQRAVDEALQREQADAQTAGAAHQLENLQRHMAELDAQATQPVMQRIQERRGSGNPLPEAVQRHLEQGLNHDLSGVRIHDDAEADKMAKGVNAIAFTTGKDIFFQSGKYNPNTQSGLELLAHEVTHTVQQSKGQVGKGIDPDSGLESEAREMGKKLAHFMPSPKDLIPPVPHKDGPHAPGKYTPEAATQRIQAGAAQHASLKPLRDLSSGVQRAMTMQRFSLNPMDAARDALQGIPGYREVSLALGRDLLTGGPVESGPGVMETLANWVPGPLKDIIKALQETNVIGKAWDWFRSELGKLNLGGAIGEIKDAIFQLPPDLGAAKNAVTSRISGVKNLILGSARHIAEIALTAITAMLGPVGQQLMTKLRGSGDTIVKILKDPGTFARNLLEAAKGGFSKFGQNSPKHLKNGLGIWLTGSSDGLKFPPTMDIKGVFMLALTVSGVTYMGMHGALQRKLGPNGAAALQRATMTLPALMPLKSGVEKAPEIASNQNAMGNEIVNDLKTEVTKSLIIAGIAKVASMLIPGGGFIQAIIGAFTGIQTLIAQGQQIAQVLISGLSSMQAIAAGNISGAINYIDATLGGSIPIILSFMSRFLGLGSFGGKAKGIIGKVKARLKAFEQRIVDRIGGMVQKILAKTKLDKLNLTNKHKAKQTREEQGRTSQASMAASKRQSSLNSSNSKATQEASKQTAANNRANTTQAQKANAANTSAANAHKNNPDPNPRIQTATKGEKTATAQIDRQTKAAKATADKNAKKVKADADKAEKEAQALAKKQTRDAQTSADKDHKEATALATKDAKGHPGADTTKSKSEATQAASKVKTKAKGEESKTTSKAKTDTKKAKDKADQTAKKTKSDADKDAKKAKTKAKTDAQKAKVKAKVDAKKAAAKKKAEADKKKKGTAATAKKKGGTTAPTAAKPKSPVNAKAKDKKKPKKDEANKDKKKDKIDIDGTYGRVNFQVLKESHSVWTVVSNGKPDIYIASVPAKAATQLSNFKAEAVKLNVYNNLRVHFSDAGHAVSRSMGILRSASTSRDKNTRLMITSHATEANNQVARYVGVIRKFIQEARTRPSQMPPVSVTFSAASYPNDLQEYRLQLFEQQVGINAKTISAWQAQRSAFLANGRGSESAQRRARRQRVAILTAIFVKRLRQDDKSLSIPAAQAEARRLANEWVATQSALHAPDQVAGGGVREIVALGKSEINGSIGGSWPHHIGILDTAVQGFLGTNPAPDPNLVKMNVRLTV